MNEQVDVEERLPAAQAAAEADRDENTERFLCVPACAVVVVFVVVVVVLRMLCAPACVLCACVRVSSCVAHDML